MRLISRSLSSFLSYANNSQYCSAYPTFMHSCLLFSMIAMCTRRVLQHPLYFLSITCFHPAVLVPSLLSCPNLLTSSIFFPLLSVLECLLLPHNLLVSQIF